MTEPEALRGHAEFEHRMHAAEVLPDYWIAQYMVSCDLMVYMSREGASRRPTGGIQYLEDWEVPLSVREQAAARGHGWYFDMPPHEIESRVCQMEVWSADQAAWLRERAKA